MFIVTIDVIVVNSIKKDVAAFIDTIIV